jgi:hypothetical protein
MNRTKSLGAAALMLVLLAACGSSGIGDVLGGGSNTGASNYEIRGTVDSVDLNSRTIYLTNVSGYSNMLSNGGGSSVRVYYDQNVPVSYQGQTYRPEDLERGDQVAVRVDENGNNSLVAQSVTVLTDVSGGSNTGSGVYGSTLHGTVRSVNTSRRTIEVDRGYGSSTTIVEYGTNTPVYFNNQTYAPADLERGDEIDIRFDDLGSGRMAARDITVTRNVNGTYGSTGTSSSTSTIRGTVRYVDTARRTIELESANWIAGFNSGAGSGSIVTVQYDTNAGVDVSGRIQPISGLERGDVIEVQATRSSSSSVLFAQRIYLVRDARN